MSRQNKWQEMTTAQLDQATRRYDEPFAADKYFRPLPAKQRAAHLKALRPGRRKVGKGCKRVMISLEQGLLHRADVYARRHGLNRSQMIARGLETLINSAA